MQHRGLGTASEQLVRCAWVPLGDRLYVDYHDMRWGVPVFDPRVLFEMLLLEGAQAGLNWRIVLGKQENYRLAFDGFDPELIARYDTHKINSLLQNPGIIRNRRKIESAITNARAFLRLRDEGLDFAGALWQFVGGKPKDGNIRFAGEIPASSAESDEMSKYLRSKGFTFVGPTICYALMQATGMVNDHTLDCFRYQELIQQAKGLPNLSW